MSADPALIFRVAALNAAAADAIDSDRLEDWPAFFADPCRYVVTTAENHRAGLPAGLIWADSRAMLTDRVAALRRANIYERQAYRHILGMPLIRAETPEGVRAETPFLVARILRDGKTDLFATGRCLDLIRLDPAPCYVERIVVCDSARFDTLLALPL